MPSFTILQSNPPQFVPEGKSAVREIDVTQKEFPQITKPINDVHEKEADVDRAIFDVCREVGIVGEDPAFLKALRAAHVYAQYDDTHVLLLGETGSGKEYLARFIHCLSKRAARPLVTVNCGSIPENLVESHLFGHKKGSFTGAVSDAEGKFKAADGGTIFLDELGELPLSAQAKLLRTLEEGEIESVGAARPQKINVKVIAATNRDLLANGVVKADITIHQNGSIEFDNSFQREVVQPYLKSRIDDKIQYDADSYPANFEVPDAIADAAPEKRPPEVEAFEKAFFAEFGFSPEAISKVVEVFTEFAVQSGDPGGTLDSLDFRRILKKGPGLTERQIETFVDRFVLPIRPAWDKKLPKGCDFSDVLPWRFFRGLSVLIRPFVEVSRSPRQFAISAPHLHRWGRYLVQSISEGALPDRLFQSTQMKSYFGSVANKKGHEFAVRVAEAVKKILPNVRLEINLTELGAPTDPNLGDIDVLAWGPASNVVFLVECKRLKAALTVRQVIQQLEEFKGKAANSEDFLFKHQRRVAWLKANPENLESISGIPRNQIKWVPLLVTSGRVPMAFIDATNFPRTHVVPIQELETKVSEFVSEAAPEVTIFSVNHDNDEISAQNTSTISSCDGMKS